MFFIVTKCLVTLKIPRNKSTLNEIFFNDNDNGDLTRVRSKLHDLKGRNIIYLYSTSMCFVA